MTEGEIAAPVAETVATPAPVEPVATKGDNEVVDVPREIKSEPVAAKEPVEKKPVSSMDAIKKAAEKVEAGEKAKLEAAKPPVKPGEQPAVKPKEAVPAAKPEIAAAEPKPSPDPGSDSDKPYKTPPSRWNPEAKAAWEALPDDNLKNEVYRTVSELEKGYNKHREGAEKWNALKEFDELAQKHKTDLPTALKNYTAIDRDLNSSNMQEKLRAIDHIFQTAGLDKTAFAKYVLGNQQQQPAAQPSNIQHTPALQPQQPQESPKLKQLEQTVETLVKTLEKQQNDQVDQEWAAWSKDKPLANDLLEPIQHYLNEGLDLDEAYVRAKEDFDAKIQSLGYVPANTSKPIIPSLPNGKTTKSLVGAPSAGSEPGRSPRSKNSVEAVKRAMQVAGFSV